MPVQRDSVATVSTARQKHYASLPRSNSNHCQCNENHNFLQVSMNIQEHTNQTSIVHQHLIDVQYKGQSRLSYSQTTDKKNEITSELRVPQTCHCPERKDALDDTPSADLLERGSIR